MKSSFKFLAFATMLSMTFGGGRTAFAQTSSTLMVSVNHSVPASEINQCLQALERINPTMGTCYFNAKVSDYIPYDQDETSTYYGVALVDVEENCAKDELNSYLTWLYEQQDKGTYTVFSNPIIGPHPGMSGRN